MQGDDDPIGIEAAARLSRRVLFGAGPGELDALAQRRRSEVLDDLLDPGGPGTTATSLFAEVDTNAALDQPLQVIGAGLAAWLDHLVVATSLEAWMTWFWHDHFAVSARVVRFPELMFAHIDLLRTHALGDFASLIRDVTVDAAMLRFLNGDTSTAGNPNENYGRELMELYTLGVGAFTEDDVAAAAAALTGWTVQRGTGRSVFRPGRHDDTTQTVVGVEGVHDVDTVVDAVTGHPACAPHVARSLATAVLGEVDDATVDELAATFVDADLALGPLARAVLELCLDGAGSEVVRGPVPWWIAVRKAYETDVEARLVTAAFQAAGQVPFAPPNVGGFPPGPSYLSAAATTARVNLAAAAAATSPPAGAAMAAASDGDLDTLALLLGRPGGFEPQTQEALRSLSDPRHRLAVAAAAPEVVIA